MPTSSGSPFGGDAHFIRVVFERAAAFGKPTVVSGSTTFKGHAKFEFVTFNHLANFLGVIFRGTATFGSASFRRDAVFEEATFNETANFGLAAVLGGGPTTFAGKVTFTSARFTKGVPAEIREFAEGASEGPG
jgi:hypothetical protein